jgi:hypothetical protein
MKSSLESIKEQLIRTYRQSLELNEKYRKEGNVYGMAYTDALIKESKWYLEFHFEYKILDQNPKKK